MFLYNQKILFFIFMKKHIDDSSTALISR